MTQLLALGGRDDGFRPHGFEGVEHDLLFFCRSVAEICQHGLNLAQVRVADMLGQHIFHDLAHALLKKFTQKTDPEDSTECHMGRN